MHQAEDDCPTHLQVAWSIPNLRLQTILTTCCAENLAMKQVPSENPDLSTSDLDFL